MENTENAAERMTPEQETRILRSAIETYGADLQMVVAIEELAELQQAISKLIRFRFFDISNEVMSFETLTKRERDIIAGICEEMADCKIMLRQLELMFGDVTRFEQEKLERLAVRLEAVHAHEDG